MEIVLTLWEEYRIVFYSGKHSSGGVVKMKSTPVVNKTVNYNITYQITIVSGKDIFYKQLSTEPHKLLNDLSLLKK